MPRPAQFLDRLADALKTLDRRRGMKLTPYQRVAAAQRWNSLADIGERYVDNLPNVPIYMLEGKDLDDYTDAIMDAKAMKIIDGPSLYDYNRADNPFLSDNIDKYQEQSEFLDWCRYNRIRPTPKSLQQFRWETYRSLPRDRKEAIFDKFERSYGYPVETGDVWLGIDDMPDFLPPGWQR